MPLAVRGELLLLATEETGCEHFGLLLGSHSGVAQLGVLGAIMRATPTVGEALSTLGKFWFLHTPVTDVFVWRQGELAGLAYTVLEGGLPGMPQLQDGAMAMALNVMRDLLGTDWRPAAVHLMRREPEDAARYASFFGAQCRFNVACSALVFPAAALDVPVQGRNAEGDALAAQPLDALSQKFGGESWSAQAYRVICRRLLRGECDQQGLAEVLGVSHRTLVRRLGLSGTSYQQLLERARFSLCRSLIKETDMRFTEVATVLGYNEASSLTRAFQRWTGMSPSQWRRSRADMS